MSYALELTKPAQIGLRELDSWLQEETLEDLDRVALNLSLLQRRRLGDVVYDFLRERAGFTYYVFVTIYLDESARVLRVDSIGFYSRRGQ